jgi:hypothetical protein
MKTIEDHFADWEAHIFGYGYGTGEPHILQPLHAFLKMCNEGAPLTLYYHEKLESLLGCSTAWLLINTLCHADIIEYGTSPRCGWLTPNGVKLRNFMALKTLGELLEITRRDENYFHCAPDCCNCDDSDCRKLNPFWPRRA